MLDAPGLQPCQALLRAAAALLFMNISKAWPGQGCQLDSCCNAPAGTQMSCMMIFPHNQ